VEGDRPAVEGLGGRRTGGGKRGRYACPVIEEDPALGNLFQGGEDLKCLSTRQGYLVEEKGRDDAICCKNKERPGKKGSGKKNLALLKKREKT